jgi:hypothetical protein
MRIRRELLALPGAAALLPPAARIELEMDNHDNTAARLRSRFLRLGASRRYLMHAINPLNRQGDAR